MPQKIKQCKRDKLKFNIMVVGESGLGKTTFLQSLLGRYIQAIDVTSRKAINDKTNHISQIGSINLTTELGDNLEIVTYDSPGYGDFINNQECVDTIKAYIRKCHEKWRALKPQFMTEAEYLEADSRIHCVFYFIAPHRMKMLDKEFIAQLAPIVPIIPVIAKADTMTVRERNEYLQIVKTTLDEISHKLGESCIYNFHGEDVSIVDGSADGDIIPGATSGDASKMDRVPNLFAIVCDPHNERVYPWGTLHIDNNNHSDFRRLQTIIFENENHIKGLLDLTRVKTIKTAGTTTKPSEVELDHHFSIRLNPKDK